MEQLPHLRLRLNSPRRVFFNKLLGSVDVLIRNERCRVKDWNEHGLEADVGVLEVR